MMIPLHVIVFFVKSVDIMFLISLMVQEAFTFIPHYDNK